jgi:hypothetical protein
MSVLQITATPSGAVDLGAPAFALMTGTRGPSGKDADTGLALFVACGRLVVDGPITTAARYHLSYSSSTVPPTVAINDDAAVLTLTTFAGKLVVQKRDGSLLFDGLVLVGAAFAAALGSIWMAAFAIFVAELVLVDVLMHQSPIKVDDLCSGSWYLTPRPTTDLSLLEPFVDGWKHDTWPYDWDLNASIWIVLPAILAGLGYAV